MRPTISALQNKKIVVIMMQNSFSDPRWVEEWALHLTNIPEAPENSTFMPGTDIPADTFDLLPSNYIPPSQF